MEDAGFVLPTDGVGLRHRLGDAAEVSVIQGDYRRAQAAQQVHQRALVMAGKTR